MPAFHYCPRCGGRLSLRVPKREHERQLVCTSCFFVFYQNSKPTSSVIPIQNNEILLCRRAINPKKGYWDMIGGFLKNGEDAEKGALREFREETGTKVQLTDMLGIFNDRYSYSTYNLFTFNVVYLGVLDKHAKLTPVDDISELRWFPIDRLPVRIAFPYLKDTFKALKIYQKTHKTVLKA